MLPKVTGYRIPAKLNEQMRGHCIITRMGPMKMWQNMTWVGGLSRTWYPLIV